MLKSKGIGKTVIAEFLAGVPGYTSPVIASSWST